MNEPSPPLPRGGYTRVSRAAEAVDSSPDVLWKMIRAGQLEATRLHGTGPLLVANDSLRDALARNRVQVAAAKASA
jgi:hypothetical protein